MSTLLYQHNVIIMLAKFVRLPEISEYSCECQTRRSSVQQNFLFVLICYAFLLFFENLSLQKPGTLEKINY